MKKRTVIKNVPVRFPLTSTILIAFLLDHYQVDGIWWGVFITVYSILWIALIAAKINEDGVDLDDIITDGKKARTFQDKLNEKMNQNK